MFYKLIILFTLLYSIIVIVYGFSTLNGKYTKDIEDFDLVIPHKLTAEGYFKTFEIPHFVEHNYESRTRRDVRFPEETVHYGIHLNGKLHHVELTPNHNFVSPNLVIERRDPTNRLNESMFRKFDKRMCHYTGSVRNYNDSRAALSTCDGLAGYVTLNKERYFIEPVAEHSPNNKGQHLHVIYKREGQNKFDDKKCGTESDWEEAWKKRFREKYQDEGTLDVPKRELQSLHRYIETLVVCDKRFITHHKNIDIEAYVMTLMNMVADYFQDESIGLQIDVIVVRIIYLEKEEEEIDLVINPDADKTLASFCKWQMKLNPKDKENPNHHDVALLLTRYDLCSDNMTSCSLMGLAYLAAACTHNEPCGINEDGGLLTGVVVAHELGHVVGSSHDKEGESSCPAQDSDESFFVMAPYVSLFTIRWSSCSRGFINSLFENGLGDCLNNEPKETMYPFKNVLPGTVYDGDAQCNMHFPNSKLCKLNTDKFCEMLTCRVSPTTCMSKGEPVIDGTHCGQNKWCYRKECVEIGERPEAVNGDWGEWSGWSECSRSCGIGISTSIRECNNPKPKNKGRYCIGEKKKIKTCNTQPCPKGTPSFRETQCAETDSEMFYGKYFHWKAHFISDEPCTLYCLNDDFQFAKRRGRVKDGTSCKTGTTDICVTGVCTKLGCDFNINSDAVEDVCGICNGDGTQCKIVDEIYTDLGAHDYKKVVTIPAGSRKISINELAPSENTIAISDKYEKIFYLNGDHNEELDGVKSFNDVEGMYSHSEPGEENLIISGPIKDDIIFYVCFYKQENVGYHYTYAEMSKDNIYKPKYHWELLEWSDCSVKCGGGFQTPSFDCIEEKSGKVSASFCTSQPKPITEPKKCNEMPCSTKWKVGNWGECLACKNKAGVRIREVECVRESPRHGAQDILVEDEECKDLKPGTRELCDAHETCSKKRHTDNLPDHLMEKVWTQTRSINKKDSEHRQALSESSMETRKGNTIIKDRVPNEELKLIKIPFRQSRLSLNLTDNAFEKMGDDVADTMDMSNAKIITGDKAAELLKILQNQNNTPGG